MNNITTTWLSFTLFSMFICPPVGIMLLGIGFAVLSIAVGPIALLLLGVLWLIYQFWSLCIPLVIIFSMIAIVYQLLPLRERNQVAFLWRVNRLKISRFMEKKPKGDSKIYSNNPDHCTFH